MNAPTPEHIDGFLMGMQHARKIIKQHEHLGARACHDKVLLEYHELRTLNVSLNIPMSIGNFDHNLIKAGNFNHDLVTGKIKERP